PLWVLVPAPEPSRGPRLIKSRQDGANYSCYPLCQVALDCPVLAFATTVPTRERLNGGGTVPLGTPWLADVGLGRGSGVRGHGAAAPSRGDRISPSNAISSANPPLTTHFAPP